MDPYGDHQLPEHRTRQQAESRHRRDVAQSIHEHQARRSEPADTALAWTVAMLTLPYVFAAVAAGAWFIVIVELAEEYQRLLRQFYPGSLIGAEASHGTNIVFALALIVMMLTGLLLVRLRLSRRWARGTRGPGMLRVSSFVLSFATIVVLILAPGLVFGAGVVVELVSPAPEGPVQLTGPIMVTAFAALWWSVRASRRSVRRAVRQRSDG